MFNRRKEARTDESVASGNSVTDSLRGLIEDTTNAFVNLVSTEDMKSAAPEYILGRMLSTKSAISADSSLAEENQRASEEASLRSFASIGYGQCGTIYALKGTTMVVKLPNSSSKADQLFEDFKCHQAVYDAFRQAPSTFRIYIHVPALKMWVTPNSNHFWSSNAGLFPKGVQVPDYGLVSERIYPLPLLVRAALVDAFAPKMIQDSKTQFLATPQHKDCLVRLYLGRRADDPVQPSNFRLRNYPLHVNQMERLQLETDYYALIMAQALAIMHWCASVDANDVEFVLGSSPQVRGWPSRQELLSMDKDSAGLLFNSDFHHRTVSVWLLDFNMCQHFDKNAAGLKKLVEGFWFNDPYYPRPHAAHAKDKALWRVFSQRYLEVSAEIGEEDMSLAFIRAVEDEGKRRSGNNSLFG